MKRIAFVATPLWIAILGVLTTNIQAEDRTLEQFKEYVQQRLPGELNDSQLDKFASLVDHDGDGVITDDEFATRMDVLAEIRSGEMDEESKEEAGDSEEKQKDDEAAQRRNRFEEMNRRMQAQLETAGIVPGKPLPNVAGLDIEGQPLELSSLKGSYAVIINGCLT